MILWEAATNGTDDRIVANNEEYQGVYSPTPPAFHYWVIDSILLDLKPRHGVNGVAIASIYDEIVSDNHLLARTKIFPGIARGPHEIANTERLAFTFDFPGQSLTVADGVIVIRGRSVKGMLTQ